MPQAKPTQVIVHRIELQQSERQMLKEFVEERQKQQWISTAGSAVQPVIIGTAAMGAAYIGIRGYQALVAALNSIDVPGSLDELMKPVYPAINSTPILGPIFGDGGVFDFFWHIYEGNSATENPLYDDLVDSEGNKITQEDLDEGSKKLREEQGVLNSILAPFGITPFPKWL